MDTEIRARLGRLLQLVDREDEHLMAVRWRLFGDDGRVDAQRVKQLLTDDLGVDRLESFGAKFGRMQDTIVDKLIPAVLSAAGERSGAAIDNLMRLERLELVRSAELWLQMRGLRNRLVHEYIERPEEFAPALERAFEFTEVMHRDYASIRAFITEHLGV